QHRHDTHRGQLGKAWFIGKLQDLRALLRAQGMSGHGAYRLRSGIAALQPGAALPALQRACIDAGQGTRRLQPGAVAMGLLDVLSDDSAILQGYHSSSPGWKIASSFF